MLIILKILHNINIRKITMDVIQNIVKHIIEKKEKKLYNVDNLDTLYFNNVFSPDKYKLSKMLSVKIMVYNNFFINEKKQQDLIALFSKAQEIYWTLNRFAQKYKYKKTKSFDIQKSLYEVEFSKCKKTHIISLIENNTKYIFRINELLNLWKTSLANCCNLQPAPIIPRNPYTGLKISIHNLYNIYFFARFNTDILINNLIKSFFYLNFDIKKFKKEQYHNLCDNAIKNYIQDSEPIQLFYDCINMVNANPRIFNYSRINEEMNYKHKIQFVHLLKEYLTYYLYSTESCNPFIKSKNRILFKKSIKNFMKKHPTFGRRIILTPRSQSQNIENFNVFAMPVIVLDGSSDEEETESESEHVEEPPALTSTPSHTPTPTPVEAQTEETYIEQVQAEETHTEDTQSTQETQFQVEEASIETEEKVEEDEWILEDVETEQTEYNNENPDENIDQSNFMEIDSFDNANDNIPVVHININDISNNNYESSEDSVNNVTEINSDDDMDCLLFTSESESSVDIY